MASSSGSPVLRPATAAVKALRKREYAGLTTMKRLAAMQLWPLLIMRALTAAATLSVLVGAMLIGARGTFVTLPADERNPRDLTGHGFGPRIKIRLAAGLVVG